MRCSRCQAENGEGLRFCEDCGARLATTCPSCGAEVTPGKRFCGSCGAALTASQPEGRFTSPQPYIPKHLVEKILTSRSALEGERKQVTVLFADIKGSMELLADRDPEEARKLLDPVLELMMGAVHRYEGTVNQVMGDGIMALFGAPLAHEDHAVRACYAALRMQETVKRYAEGVQRTAGVPISIRVGVNSGEVVVRSIGSDLRMDYTAVGQTTHLAGRMEQMAMPGSIMMTAGTLALAEGYVGVKPLGPVTVKGVVEPIEVFELTGAELARTRLQAAAARGLTRFVGRDVEVAAVRQGLERAHAGHGQVVGLVGEPGVGKSRIIWEFTHPHRTKDWLVLESSSVPYGKATPYLPVTVLLRAYFQIEDRDNVRKIREKVTGKLLSLDHTLWETLPAFLALLDVPVEEPGWQALDPSQRRRQTLDAVKRLLLRQSQIQTLLLVFEDLHWIDSETQALLDGLVDSLPAARVLLLVTYRPEYQHQWGSRTCYTQLRLDPLPPETAEQLLGALLGPDASLDPLKRALIARAEGNPFFLEESVRAVVETGCLLGERGAYRLARPLPTIEIPPTVQAVLAARIDRLPPRDKAILQMASVVGKDVPFALLQAIAEHADDELHAAIARLQGGEFLYEVGIFPDLEYTFTHALTHDVTYGSLLQDRRRTLHGQILDAIERLYPDRLPEHVERLAHHAFRGEAWGKAVTYSRQAGVKAIAASSHREAVHWLEQAIGALERLPQTDDARALAVDLHLDTRSALLLLGEFSRMLERLRAAERLAAALGDRRRLGRVCAYLTDYFRQVGDYEQALEAGRRGLAAAEVEGDLGILLATNIYLGHVYYDTGQYGRATAHFRRNVATLGPEMLNEQFGLPYLVSVHSRTWLAVGLVELGLFNEAIEHANEALRIAEGSNHASSLVSAHMGLGRAHLRRGDLERAVPLLERGLELARLWNMRLVLPFLTDSLGLAYALAGRTVEAFPLLQEALDLHVTMRGTTTQSTRRLSLAQGHLLAGNAVEAALLASRALELAEKNGERGYLAYAHGTLAEASMGLRPPDYGRAEKHWLAAAALSRDLEMRPLAARCHLGLGKLYPRSGKRDQAREHLTAATTMYREMDMRFWLEQAERELQAL
ncbi:MAG TPA: adenylate/guanylate cyclase domain-containing protein [Methylomirabilota bacterium]|nr:adenylate/guanylate cyclase domain-containing protein [Methylomirabilota bacterium]